MSEKSSSSWLPFLFVAGGGAYYFFVRPALLTWGTLPGEAERTLPGDDIIMHPALQMTHALDINTAREAVWLWLAQMGREDVGFYALDAINNHGVRSASSLRPQMSPVAVGMRLNNGLQVLQVEASKTLVIGGFNQPSLLGHSYDLTYAYHLQELDPQRTRLTLRLRLYAYGLQGLVYPLLAEPFFCLQAILQLNNIATLASQTQVVVSKEKANGHQPLKI